MAKLSWRLTLLSHFTLGGAGPAVRLLCLARGTAARQRGGTCCSGHGSDASCRSLICFWLHISLVYAVSSCLTSGMSAMWGHSYETVYYA